MLKRFSDPPTLVIAGAWNPDILSPSWIAKEAMGLELNQDFPVNVQLPIGNPTQRPTFTFEKIKFNAARGQLTFFLTHDDLVQVNRSINTAAAILELLSYTPITGFGFNFSHEIEAPCAPLRKTFSGSDISIFLDDADAQTVVQKWGSSIKTQHYLLSLNAELEGNKTSLQFNIHYEVTSATGASQLLRTAGLYSSAEQVTSDIAQKLDDLQEGTL